MIRDLRDTIEREGAALGVFPTLAPPTRAMTVEAAAADQFEMEDFRPVPRIQIVTVEVALALHDRAVRLPARRDGAFGKAPREADETAQGDMGFQSVARAAATTVALAVSPRRAEKGTTFDCE